MQSLTCGRAAVSFCLTLVLVAACGRSPEAEFYPSESELLSDELSSPEESLPVGDIADAPQWIRATHLTVEGAATRSADVRVLMKAEGEGKDLKCVFETKHKNFEDVEKKWTPLPLWLVNPTKNDAELDPAFGQSLDFPKDDKFYTESVIEFRTTFTRGDYSFTSLWRVVPKLEGKDDAKRCSAVTELCAKIEFSKEKSRTVCLGKWKWIDRLVAIPHYTNWLRGKPTDVTALRAEYKKVDAQGNVVLDPKGKPVIEKESY